jgi:hypothetical protein
MIQIGYLNCQAIMLKASQASQVKAGL